MHTPASKSISLVQSWKFCHVAAITDQRDWSSTGLTNAHCIGQANGEICSTELILSGSNHPAGLKMLRIVDTPGTNSRARFTMNVRNRIVRVGPGRIQMRGS